MIRRARTIIVQVLVPVEDYDDIMIDLTSDIEDAIQRQRIDYAPLEIRNGCITANNIPADVENG
jgi:hypothetical protein